MWQNHDMSKTPLPADAMPVEAAGALIGVTGCTIRRWVKLGRLAGFKVGAQLRVSREDVLAQVERVVPERGPALQTKAERRARDAEVDAILRAAKIRR